VSDTLHLIDLASERLGAAALAASDEFFAAKDRLIHPDAPIFIADKYVSTGKWMDGWESRRRREPGHDWCLIRLGARGVIERLVVDTSFFVGNFPEQCSLEGCDRPDLPAVEALRSPATTWISLLPASRLSGNSLNEFILASSGPVTHLRLNIFPDGGVARLRAWGRATPDWTELDHSAELVDLAAAEHGACIRGVSDMFFGAAQNLLLPGRASDMSGGWETRRRRGPGHDWVVVELGARGRVLRCEIDTLHFKGNAPGRAAVDVTDAPLASSEELASAAWRELLPEAPLGPHQLHRFQAELRAAGIVTHARLRIFPDGGVSRLRLLGRTERAEKLIIGLGKLNYAPESEARASLMACCGSQRWADRLLAVRPFSCAAQLTAASDAIWRALAPHDWKEAFKAHPRIGETGSSAWSRQPLPSQLAPGATTAAEIADKNRAYEERFGFVFLICATGKSSDAILAALRRRLTNETEFELRHAAEEQRQITHLRLEKWLVA
jgi:allantoicase